MEFRPNIKKCKLMHVGRIQLVDSEKKIQMLKVIGGHTLKLEKLRFIIRDNRKFFFSQTVRGCWNSLDQEMVDAPRIQVTCLQVRLNKN